MNTFQPKEMKENVPEKTGFDNDDDYFFMCVNFNGLEDGIGIFLLFYL